MSRVVVAVVVAVLACAACTKQPTPAATPPPPAHAHTHEAPQEPSTTKAAAFLFPQDGSTVFSDVDVAFRVGGMDLKRAGDDPSDRGSGHHHLMIDSPSVPEGQPVPWDDQHLHFDDGAARVSVRLPPGPHALEMQLADGEHRSYGPALAARIRVTVVPVPVRVGVSFLNVKEGAAIDAPARLQLGVDGFKLQPAGGDVLDKTSGHFHVIVDNDAVLAGTTIPDDGTHGACVRSGSEVTLPLSPGPHTLTAQLADAAHASYGPRMATTIAVTVR